MPDPARVILRITAVVLVAVCVFSCDKPEKRQTISETSRQPAKNNGVTKIEGSPATTSPMQAPPVDDKENAIQRSPLSDTQASLRKLQIEKISGYKVPGEYFILSSKRFLDAMAAVTLPVDYFSNLSRTYPMVIVFGGAGESIKPPRSGALAWMHYYKMDEAIRALERQKLEPGDFRGLVRPEELEHFNRELHQHPYQGVIVVCPYSPPLSLGRIIDHPDYESYLMEELVPALISHYRVAEGKMGIDGVSNGGARSMYYGFKYPQIFRALGSVQGSFGPFLDIYEELIQKNSDILKKKPIQLITSDRDSMRVSVQQMHELLKRYNIPHRYVQMTGPHDYVFNQGPGSIGLLLFHDKVLRQDKRDKNAH